MKRGEQCAMIIGILTMRVSCADSSATRTPLQLIMAPTMVKARDPSGLMTFIAPEVKRRYVSVPTPASTTAGTMRMPVWSAPFS